MRSPYFGLQIWMRMSFLNRRFSQISCCPLICFTNSYKHEISHERYMEIIPTPDVVLLDNVAHYPQVEAPERVFAAFTEFHNAQKSK